MSDTIERTILIAAPIERVWDIVTLPEHMGRWFGDAGAEREGDVINMRWTNSQAELRVVREEAPHAFAYRWDAHTPEDVGDTLVEFTLTTEGDRTRVTVVESGWTALRTDPANQATLREGNVRGWKSELGDLERYAADIEGQQPLRPTPIIRP
jgi:uncharacterized protein YndB with AHSA1/START domain